MVIEVEVGSEVVERATYQLLRIDREKWLGREDVVSEVKRICSGEVRLGAGVQNLIPANCSADLTEKAQKVAKELFPELYES